MNKPFTIAELRQLKEQVHPNQTLFAYLRNPLVIRAASAGFVTSDVPQWTFLGKTHLKRLDELEQAVGNPKVLANHSEIAIFRTTDYDTAELAQKEGALYSLPIPDNGKLPKYRLQELQEVLRVVGDSLANDPNMLQMNRKNGEHWEDLTATLTRDILAELQQSSGPNTTAEHIDNPENFYRLDHMVLIRAHDYEPNAIGFANAEEDGALRMLPITIGPLKAARMSPGDLTWLNTLEQVAKAAAHCIDSNTEMQLAFAMLPPQGLAIQYVTLNDVKESYCHHPRSSSFSDLVHAEITSTARSQMLSQTDDPNDINSFVLKAVGAVDPYAIYSENPDKVTWKDYLSALMPHTPDNISFNTLSEALPYESFKALCQHISNSPDSVLAVEAQEILSAAILRHATVVLDRNVKPAPTLHQERAPADELRPQNSPSAPGFRR